MKILITGANGYLGRELISWFSNIDKVNIFALDKYWGGQSDIFNGHVKKIKISLDKLKPENKFGRGRIDTVVHLAAKVSVDLCRPSQALELMQQNCMNLVRILDWSIANKANRFVFVSSMTVYSPPKRGFPQNEEQPKKPISIYGITKLFGEEILKIYAEQTGVRVTILRLPGLYGGERKAGLLYNLAKKIKHGEVVKLDFKGKTYWETMHVSDAAKVLGQTIMRAKKYPRLGIFNIGYEDRRVAIRPIIKIMQKYFRSKSSVIIKNEDYYKPFSMQTGKIRKYLGTYQMEFNEGLNSFMREIE